VKLAGCWAKRISASAAVVCAPNRANPGCWQRYRQEITCTAVPATTPSFWPCNTPWGLHRSAGILSACC